MRFKLFVGVATFIVELILTVIIFMMFFAFAMRPTEILLLTNSLVLVMIMTQLYAVNVLMNIYEKLGKERRRKR